MLVYPYSVKTRTDRGASCSVRCSRRKNPQRSGLSPVAAAYDRRISQVRSAVIDRRYNAKPAARWKVQRNRG